MILKRASSVSCKNYRPTQINKKAKRQKHCSEVVSAFLLTLIISPPSTAISFWRISSSLSVFDLQLRRPKRSTGEKKDWKLKSWTLLFYIFKYISSGHPCQAPSHPPKKTGNKMIVADSPFCVSFVEQVSVAIWKLSLVTGITPLWWKGFPACLSLSSTSAYKPGRFKYVLASSVFFTSTWRTRGTAEKCVVKKKRDITIWINTNAAGGTGDFIWRSHCWALTAEKREKQNSRRTKTSSL